MKRAFTAAAAGVALLLSVAVTAATAAPTRHVAQNANARPAKITFTVGGTPEATDLITFHKDSVRRLLDGRAGRERT